MVLPFKRNVFFILYLLCYFCAEPPRIYVRIGHDREYPPGFKGPSLIRFTLAPTLTLGPKDGNVTSYKSFLFHAVELNLGT